MPQNNSKMLAGQKSLQPRFASYQYIKNQIGKKPTNSLHFVLETSQRALPHERSRSIIPITDNRPVSLAIRI